MELLEISTVVRQAYAKQELRLLAREAVIQVFDDPIDVEFLSGVGVPLVEEFEINFNLADRLPPLREYLAGKGNYLPSWPTDVWCLNEKEDFVFGIDKAQGDAVICIDLKGCDPVLFISTKVRFFVGFFAECRLHLERIRSGKMTQERSFEMSLDRMRRWDAKAVNQGWWQGIFETINFYG